MSVKKTSIIIRRSLRPESENMNDELQWFCDTLGLFGTRDKDKSCFRLFVVMLRGMRQNNGMTSDELAEKVGLSRGTVVHHLHKLIGSGLVKQEMNHYMLRVNNLSTLIDEVEKDIITTMDELRKSAGELDGRLKP
ncbi:MAG: ArsR family transcriptional regulator [Nanoarchaeota archaeon]|nr:ArsR family transcriptional regulator [Nanoarchaeota archaeon]